MLGGKAARRLSARLQSARLQRLQSAEAVLGSGASRKERWCPSIGAAAVGLRDGGGWRGREREVRKWLAKVGHKEVAAPGGEGGRPPEGRGGGRRREAVGPQRAKGGGRLAAASGCSTELSLQNVALLIVAQCGSQQTHCEAVEQKQCIVAALVWLPSCITFFWQC